MPFTWNMVTKNLHAHEFLRKKISEKITKLEKHLKPFPADAVHLHFELEQNPKKECYTAALTLRVPSDILHSEKSADDVIKAFDDAVKALLRELESLKSNLRGEKFWKRKERREQLHQLKATGFAAEPQAEETGPQRYQDVVRDLFQQHYRELLRHARRHIHHDELAGDLPKGAVDPREVVDEAARKAMTKASQKPKGMGWIIWFYHLIHEELKRQRHLLKEKQAKEVPTEERTTLPELSEQALHPLEQIVERDMEPQAIHTEDVVASPENMPPDEFVAQEEVLEQLQQEMKKWPRPEREVFELYYVEGLEPEEIAMVTGQPLKTVRERLASVQQRVRDRLLEQEALA